METLGYLVAVSARHRGHISDNFPDILAVKFVAKVAAGEGRQL